MKTKLISSGFFDGDTQSAAKIKCLRIELKSKRKRKKWPYNACRHDERHKLMNCKLSKLENILCIQLNTMSVMP